VLLVTHDLQAAALADRRLSLRDGMLSEHPFQDAAPALDVAPARRIATA
jgi:ABC-type lipoprotein export system ATPase subunit